MPKATSKSVLLVTGLILVAAGLGVFAWYNTVVLDAAEIKRLEAGGSSNGTMGELLVLMASPVLVLLGAVLLYMAWSRRGVRT